MKHKVTSLNQWNMQYPAWTVEQTGPPLFRPFWPYLVLNLDIWVTKHDKVHQITSLILHLKKKKKRSNSWRRWGHISPQIPLCCAIVIAGATVLPLISTNVRLQKMWPSLWKSVHHQWYILNNKYHTQESATSLSLSIKVSFCSLFCIVSFF